MGLAVFSLFVYAAYRKLKGFNRLFDKGYVPYPRNMKKTWASSIMYKQNVILFDFAL